MPDLVLLSWPGPLNCGGCDVAGSKVPDGGKPFTVVQGLPSSFTFLADGHSDAPITFTTNPSTVVMTTAGDAGVVVQGR